MDVPMKQWFAAGDRNNRRPAFPGGSYAFIDAQLFVQNTI
jgi:hypothetical protein